MGEVPLYSIKRSYANLDYYRVRAPGKVEFEGNVGGRGFSGFVDHILEYMPVNLAI